MSFLLFISLSLATLGVALTAKLKYPKKQNTGCPGKLAATESRHPKWRNPFAAFKAKRLFLALSLITSFGWAQELINTSEHVIYQDGPGSYAIFIPESRLQEQELWSLPIAQQQWDSINEHWQSTHDRRLNAPNDQPQCTTTAGSHLRLDPDPNATSLASILNQQDVVIQGTVESIQSGWGISGVQTAVYLRVQETIRAPNLYDYVVDDLVCLTIRAGRVFMDGEVFCNETDQLISIPTVGDQVLATGFRHKRDPIYIGSGHIFKILDGMVIPQPYRSLAEREAQPWETVRRNIDLPDQDLSLFAKAQPASCATRRYPPVFHLTGSTEVNIPTQGLPPYIQEGFEAGAAIWAEGCDKPNIPELQADVNTPPPADGGYDPAEVIQIKIEDREPVYDPVTESWTSAWYEAGTNGTSTIHLTTKCPAPVGTRIFGYCNLTAKLIAWGSKQGKKVIAHELGHVLGLDHDTCATKSIMQPSPVTGAQVRSEHCDEANIINCDESNPNCPEDPDSVPFTIAATGIEGIETLYISRVVTDPSGDTFSDEYAITSAGQISPEPMLVGQSFSMSDAFINNPQKNCTAAPTSGTATDNTPIHVQVTCDCETPPATVIDKMPSCEMQFPLSEFRDYAPILPPHFINPWWEWEWGPPNGNLPCNRETICVDGPIVKVVIDGVCIFTQTLICTDQCTNKMPFIFNDHGPSIKLELPDGDVAQNGQLVVSGWAVDRHNLDGYAFYVDEQRVSLSNWQEGIHRPESCTQAAAANQVNCNPYSGFQGVLDTSALSEGPHELQLVAVDLYPQFPAATLATIQFTVEGQCSDVTKPTVSWADYLDGDNIQMTSSTILLRANAEDNPGGSGISDVRFVIDGTRLNTDYNAPYQWEWPASVGSHELKVVAFDHCGNRRATTINVTVSALAPSQVPSLSGTIDGLNLNGLTVYSTAPTVVFNWTHASDPTGIQQYQLVLQPTDGSGFLYTPTTPFPNTSYSLTTSSLEVGMGYSIHIKAQNGAGIWGPYRYGGAFTIAQPGPVPPVPDFIAQLNGSNIDGTSIQVTNPNLQFSWTHPEYPAGIEKYQIVIQPVSGGWLYSPQVNYPNTQHSIQTSNLVASTTYSYHIRARNHEGVWGPFITGGNFTIVAAGPPPTVPNFVARINGINIDGTGVNVTNPNIQFNWTHPNYPAGIDKYQIVIQPVSGGWLYSPQVNYPSTSHSIQTSNLVVGTTYSYHIRARSLEGVWGPFITGGGFTIEAAGPPPAVPNFVARVNGVNINGTTTSSGPTINFSWTHPFYPAGLERYHIVVQPTDGSGFLYSETTLYPNATFTIQTSGLLLGQSYSYHVRAMSTAGDWGPYVRGGDFTVASAPAPKQLLNQPK